MENRLSFRGMSNAYNYGIWLAGFNGTATTSRFCRSKTESTSIEDVPAWVSSCRGWKAELQTLQGTRIPTLSLQLYVPSATSSSMAMQAASGNIKSCRLLSRAHRLEEWL
jgi:hypothetical protein